MTDGSQGITGIWRARIISKHLDHFWHLISEMFTIMLFKYECHSHSGWLWKCHWIISRLLSSRSLGFSSVPNSCPYMLGSNFVNVLKQKTKKHFLWLAFLFYFTLCWPLYEVGEALSDSIIVSGNIRWNKSIKLPFLLPISACPCPPLLLKRKQTWGLKCHLVNSCFPRRMQCKQSRNTKSDIVAKLLECRLCNKNLSLPYIQGFFHWASP